MSLKIGNTDLNKSYLGNTEILKMYLGSTLVFDNTTPPAPPVPVDGYLEALNVGTGGYLEYPEIYMQAGDFVGSTLYKDSLLKGYLTVESGTWYFNTSTGSTDQYAVYWLAYDTPINGYDYVYYMQDLTVGEDKWKGFRSNTDPLTVVDRTVLNVTPVSSLDQQNNNSHTKQFTSDTTGDIYSFVNINGVSEWYPYSNNNYLDLGVDVSLDGFLCASNAWSFGFKTNVDVPIDEYLGQIMFARNDVDNPVVGNYTGYKLSSGEGFLYYGKEWLVSGGVQGFLNIPTTIPAGSWFTMTCDSGRYVDFYINGQLTETLRWGSGQMINDSTKSVLFGLNPYNGSFNKGDSSSTARLKTAHGCFQGDISNLWIANGVQFTSGQTIEINSVSAITDSVNYSAVTHAWQVNDTLTGNTFSDLKGGVTMTAKTYNY